MKVRFKIDKDLCIPAMACIVAEPDIYELDDSGKASIKKNLSSADIKELMAENDEGWVEIDTDEKGYERILDSAKTCPVLAIFVDIEEDGAWKRVYPE